MEEVTVVRQGEKKILAIEIIRFLQSKEVTYGEAIEALEDAQSFLRRASLKNKI